jgi:hypothetical protein
VLSAGGKEENPMLLRCLVLALCSQFLGCTAPQVDPIGDLSLALTSEASGAHYRLVGARVSLDGPETRTVNAEADQETLAVELAAGSYQLTLLPGWSLERTDKNAAGPVSAKLVSENPSEIEIVPGATSEAVLRFELSGGQQAAMAGTGTLAVRLELEQGDGGAPVEACPAALKINEIDVDQTGSDAAEFVEIINAGKCSVALADVTLELMNGGDGKSYAHYALADAAADLKPSERLLIADPALLSTLALTTPTLALRSSGLQNGPDGVRLLKAAQTLDSLAYGGPVTGAGEGMAAASDDETSSLARCPDGLDSDTNMLDFKLAMPTPGSANACG